MRLPVPGKLAFNGTKTLQILEGHLIKPKIGSQGINAVFRVPRIVDKVKSLIPGTVLLGKHQTMGRGHDFGQSGGPSPVAGSSSVDSMNVHERHQSSGRTRISQNDLLTIGTLNGSSISWRAFRPTSKSVGQFQGF